MLCASLQEARLFFALRCNLLWRLCMLGPVAVLCDCMQGLDWRGRYLHALEALRDSPFLARCKRTTRLRLQMELHSLTQVHVPGVLLQEHHAL